MSKWVFLSHRLDETSPGFAGKSGFTSRALRSISSGDSSNSSFWEMVNHIGTHVDAPFHFVDGAPKIDDYAASEWVFEAPFLIDHEARTDQLIGLESWLNLIPVDADLVLIRTGFEKSRASNVYWKHNPGIAPELAEWLRTQRPNVRAIGFDFISVTSFQNREVGREAHRALLDPERPGRPILPIEDLSLKCVYETPSQVVVLPLRVRGADGAPVTVIAKCGERLG